MDLETKRQVIAELLRSGRHRLVSQFLAVADETAGKPTPKRVTAGAADFGVYGKGTDAKKVFNQLVQDARYQHGAGGYTGSIAEKSSFKIVSEPLSMHEAERLADKMLDRNPDKWGPAFAIPIASSKVLKDVEQTVKVKATNDREARKLGEEALRAKVKSTKGQVEVTVKRITSLKAAGLLAHDVKKSTERYWALMNPSGEVSGRRRFPDRKAAMEAVKERLQSASYDMQTGDQILVAQIAVNAVVTVTGKASKAGTYQVDGNVKVVQPGRVEGYYFFGLASS